MRSRRIVLAVLVLPFLAACESTRTIPGGEELPCVGLNGEKLAGVKYEYSARNIALGLVFSELIAPPVFVLLDELECPVRRLAAPKPPTVAPVK